MARTTTVEPLPVITGKAKALMDKGDAAIKKADEYYIAAGRYAAEVKTRFKEETDGKLTWAQYCETHFARGRRRVDQLIAIARSDNPEQALAESRAAHAAKMRESRESHDSQIYGSFAELFEDLFQARTGDGPPLLEPEPGHEDDEYEDDVPDPAEELRYGLQMAGEQFAKLLVKATPEERREALAHYRKFLKELLEKKTRSRQIDEKA